MTLIFRPKTSCRTAWIEMKGTDAADYLHRMSTVDIKHLDVGTASRGFFLNPQGKIRADFFLNRLEKDRLIFDLEAGPDGVYARALSELIEQFHFSEDFVTESLDWETADLFDPAPDTASPLIFSSTLGPGVLISDRASRDFGHRWRRVAGPHHLLEAWLQKNAKDATELSDATLEHWRILALEPARGRETTDDTNPLELGLRSGVADNKGCYPGQEVIEKILALGSPAKRLVLIEGSLLVDRSAGPIPPAGTPIQSGDPATDIGILTSVTSTPTGGLIGLSLVRKNHAQVGLSVSISPYFSTQIVKVKPYE